MKRTGSWSRLLQMAAAGALTAAPLAAFWLIYGRDATNETLLVSAMKAAVPEETAKLAALLALARLFGAPRSLRQAVFRGLSFGIGFAATECVVYAALGGWAVTLLRLVTAVPCHAFLGVVMAQYLAQYAGERRRGLLVKAWLVPTVLHGLYDYPLMTNTGVDVSQSTVCMVLSVMVLMLLAAWTRHLLSYDRDGVVGAHAVPSLLPPE